MKNLAERTGLDLGLNEERLSLSFGPGLLHPEVEVRRLDDVRSMLEDPRADGPDALYAIYMDVCRSEDAASLRQQGLLYGAMVFNRGSVGREILRSQSHAHVEKAGTGLRYSEVFEFWSGRGYVYLQKEYGPRVSRALLVPVEAGDRLILPVGWVHWVGTVGEEILSFGAWCARDNIFEYQVLRALGGPAHYVHLDGSVAVNGRYEQVPELERVSPDALPHLGIPADRPIYTLWREHPQLFGFVADPQLVADAWTLL